jgi:Cu2+-exporting ATPase
VEHLNRSQRQNASALEMSLTKEFPGLGVEVRNEGGVIRFGRLEFAMELSGDEWQIPPQFADKTISVLADQVGLVAVFVLNDSLRDDAIDVVQELQRSGKQVLLLSGDRVEVVKTSAEACGISQYYAELKPDQKCEMIRQLQAQGAVVAMVGDGMNDGPALSLANVSIAMGQGAPISQTRSDCLLMSNRLSDLSFAVKVSQFSYRLIQENLTWALFYNLIAIPAAVIGWLEPWHAALGMSLSSLLVVLNGLRVLRLQPAVMLFQTTNERN